MTGSLPRAADWEGDMSASCTVILIICWHEPHKYCGTISCHLQDRRAVSRDMTEPAEIRFVGYGFHL